MQPVYEEYDEEPPRRSSRRPVEEQETHLFAPQPRHRVSAAGGPASDPWSVPGKGGQGKRQKRPGAQPAKRQPIRAEYDSQGYIRGEVEYPPTGGSQVPAQIIQQRGTYEQAYKEVPVVPFWFDLVMDYGKWIISFLVLASIVAGFLFRHIGFYQWLFH